MMNAITVFGSSGLDNLESGNPVAVLLHGYGADERDLPGIMSALPDLAWVSPRAPEKTQVGGWGWYETVDPLNPSTEELLDATATLWEWIDAFLPETSPLVVIGFSQGGLMATQLLRTRPSRLLATGILAGFVGQGSMPADEELLALKPKVFYGRGVEDMAITRDAVASLNGWLQSHTRAVTKTYPALGHSIDQRVLQDLSKYLEPLLGA
ncbi:unannotated protein [freshwater metagenome]|uniref:Unannotated protein n=1 Tax=freshwater metagenome TaxID=449393 RepID=A0A6J7KF07_9ZZZZ|nr:hypothetical protein [Actinomycetota bacterium]